MRIIKIKELTKEQLAERLKIWNIEKIARAEEVSYNTIRKWAIKHELIIPKKRDKKNGSN